MFCKYCGNQVADDVLFCPKCGKKLSDANPNSEPGVSAQNGQKNNSESNSINQNSSNENFTKQSDSANSNFQSNANSVSSFESDVSQNLSRLNPFCIVAVIFTILSFFIDFFGVFAYASLIFSIIGCKSAKKYNEKGKMGAIICICLSAIFSLIQIIMSIMWVSDFGYLYIGGIVSIFRS